MAERARHRRAPQRVPQRDDGDGQARDVRQIVPCIGKQPEGMGEQSPDDLRHDDRNVERDSEHQPLLAAGVSALRGAHVINGTPNIAERDAASWCRDADQLPMAWTPPSTWM